MNINEQYSMNQTSNASYCNSGLMSSIAVELLLWKIDVTESEIIPRDESPLGSDTIGMSVRWRGPEHEFSVRAMHSLLKHAVGVRMRVYAQQEGLNPRSVECMLTTVQSDAVISHPNVDDSGGFLGYNVISDPSRWIEINATFIFYALSDLEPGRLRQPDENYGYTIINDSHSGRTDNGYPVDNQLSALHTSEMFTGGDV